MPDLVACHSEYEYADRPTSLYWEGDRLEVSEVLRRWRAPGRKCFRVLTADGQEFDLFYDEQSDIWHIEQL